MPYKTSPTSPTPASHLRGLRALRRLAVQNQPHITDAGVALLGELAELRLEDFRGCRDVITPGLVAMLERLSPRLPRVLYGE